MKVKYSKTFAKQYDKADAKIQIAFKKRVKLFQIDPLKGNYKGYRSINITGDWRALYTEPDNVSDTVTFKILGTHSQLYR
jgi:addiction module RelE/StbE family toxin